MANLIKWLLPKEKQFFLMLIEQASNVLEGANEFKRLIDNYNNLSDAEKKSAAEKIKDIENRGDNITHEIMGNLDKAFITPIDKEDISRMATLLDDIIDLINATSIRLVIFKIGKVDSHITALAAVVQDIVRRVYYGVIGVSKLKNLNRFYIDAHTLENKADDAYHLALENLLEKKNAVEIIKYREIYEYLENITDKCEDVANVIESIVMKHA